jgi:hypothetical protein
MTIKATTTLRTEPGIPPSQSTEKISESFWMDAVCIFKTGVYEVACNTPTGRLRRRLPTFLLPLLAELIGKF